MKTGTSLFIVGVTENNGEAKFLFYDGTTSIRINNFDFTKIDSSTDFSVDFTILTKSRKLTNLQFKKKLKRTITELLSESLTLYINTTTVEKEHVR